MLLCVPFDSDGKGGPGCGRGGGGGGGFKWLIQFFSGKEVAILKKKIKSGNLK